MGAERGAGERFDAQLVSFGLETQETLRLNKKNWSSKLKEFNQKTMIQILL